MRYWTECREFYKQFRDQYTTTGAILPSGKNLAKALAKQVAKGTGPRRILEIGPGTGAVTSGIVQALKPGDQLDIVEINDQFVEVLRKRFDEDPLFVKVKGQAKIIHAPLQEVPGEAVYDLMVSGLPLNNFSMELVRDIFKSYERLLKPEGTLSYFEYVWIRQMKTPFVAKSERSRLSELNAFLQEKIRHHQVEEDLVMLNMPPAVARHFCFGRNRHS